MLSRFSSARASSRTARTPAVAWLSHGLARLNELRCQVCTYKAQTSLDPSPDDGDAVPDRKHDRLEVGVLPDKRVEAAAHIDGMRESSQLECTKSSGAPRTPARLLRAPTRGQEGHSLVDTCRRLVLALVVGPVRLRKVTLAVTLAVAVAFAAYRVAKSAWRDPRISLKTGDMLSDQRRRRVATRPSWFSSPCTGYCPACLSGKISKSSRVGLYFAREISLTAKITPSALSKSPSRTAWT